MFMCKVICKNWWSILVLLIVMMHNISPQVLDHIDQVYFLDGSCSRVMRPLHSLTLKFMDRELKDNEFHVPDSDDIDCYITFTSDEYTDDIKRLVSVKGRDRYHNISNPHTCENGITPTDCVESGAYIQVYYGGGDDNPALTLAATYCGSSEISYMEAPVQYRSVTVRLVVKAVAQTTTQLISTVAAYQSQTSAVAQSAAVSSVGAAVTGGSSAVNPATSTAVLSTLATTMMEQNVTTDDPTTSSCGLNFTIDITSFIVGNCHQDGRRNNKDQYYCKKTDKCLSRRLKCDGYVANNCGDYTDNLIGKPSFCGKPNLALDLLWLWILLGVLALLALLYWCCWRPGWFVWRMGFIRNCCYNTSCYNCSAKCNTCCCRSCIKAAANKSGNPCGGGRGVAGGSAASVAAGDGAGRSNNTDKATGKERSKRRNRKGVGGAICCPCCRPSKVKDDGGSGSGAGNDNNVTVTSDSAGGPWEGYFNNGGFHLRRHRF